MASQPAMAIFEKSDTSQKLFCGGLPGMITTEDLRLHFEKFGTLDECVVKHSPGNVGNAFGFLWVRPVEAAEKIMAQDHIIHTASGHDVSIPAPVLARNQRTPDKGLRQTPDPRAAPGKLFVGGLSNSTTVEEYKVARPPAREAARNATHPPPPASPRLSRPPVAQPQARLIACAAAQVQWGQP